MTDVPPPEPTPALEEPPSVEIHKPKPVHSWREFLSEVGVIVLGICIAIGLEQLVESAKREGQRSGPTLTTPTRRSAAGRKVMPVCRLRAGPVRLGTAYREEPRHA